MRIAIDISSIIYGTGVAAYTQELVKGLAKVDIRNEYVLFGGSLRRRGEFVDWFDKERFPENFQLKTFYWPPKVADIFWNKLRWPPLEWFVGKVDVVHSPDWTLPPTKAKKVVTIHDLYFLEHPEETDPGIYAAQKRRLELVKQEADVVIAVSESTKRDVVRLLGVPEKKVKVVYEAAGIVGNIKNQKLNVKYTDQISNILGKYGISKPYLLAVSTVERRKNYVRLTEAFAEIKNQKSKVKNTYEKSNIDLEHLRLIIVGREGNAIKEVREKIKEQRLEDRVKVLGYIPKEDLEVLFKNAEALVFPSLYEGFGIPVLVGFSNGLPVVTSDVSSLPEVGGKAAIYVDPLDVGSITGGIRKVLEMNKGERGKLAKKGYEQLKKFSWEKCARETLRVYEEALN
jgi:glycosyltransferase involved in cell wall biosynthesis